MELVISHLLLDFWAKLGVNNESDEVIVKKVTRDGVTYSNYSNITAEMLFENADEMKTDK